MVYASVSVSGSFNTSKLTHKKLTLTVHFLVASDELQRKSSEDSSTRWSDGLSEDTIGLSDAQFESRQRRAKTKPSAPDDLTPWSRWSVDLSDGRVKANRGDLVAGSSAPDDPTHCRCIASEQLCQRILTAMDVGRAPDEPTPWKI
jgi:hypothetical protein